MADDAGFLDRLGVGSTDERAIREARQQELLANGRSAVALGQGAAPLVGGLVEGVSGFFTGGGFKESFQKGMVDRDDALTAQAAGVDVPTLRSRREIRRAVAESNVANDGSFEAQEQLAKIVAQKAAETGNLQAQGQALAELTRIRQEKKEFEKLSAQTRREQANADEAEAGDIQDIYLTGESTPRSAQIIPADPITGRPAHARFSDKKGNIQEVPLGQFSTTDPLKNRPQQETLDQRWRRIVPSGERSAISTAVNSAASSVTKYRRIMSTVRDLVKGGEAGSVLSTSGRFLSGVDNLVRNVEGIVRPILGTSLTQYNGRRVTSEQARSDVRRRAQDVNGDFWKNDLGENILPEELRSASKEAQEMRAMLMEMAYISARLAEPSNRGLSDNDIKNALVRIAGDTADPEVMLTRFATMAFDTQENITNLISTHTHKFDGVTPDELELFVGGNTLRKYREDMGKLQEEFALEFDDVGRPTFEGEAATTTEEVDPNIELFDRILGQD